MDTRIDKLRMMFDAEAPNIDCQTAIMLIELYIDGDNVAEMLKLVAAYPKLTLAFWKQINAAPHESSEWAGLSCVASDREVAERAIARYRRTVDIVRGHLDPVGQRRDQLFR